MLKETSVQPTLFDQHFHNSICASETELKVFEENARTQDEKVLEFFEYYHATDWTAEEIWKALFSETRVPLTSIRRSFSNLKNKFKIEKSGVKRMGLFGIEVSAYKLK